MNSSVSTAAVSSGVSSSEIRLSAPLASSWGLYIHIPYCAKICHYCDFAKTAWFDNHHTSRYFSALSSHLRYLVAFLKSSQGQLSSVYFGGGTPSLFAEEYEPIFDIIRSVMAVGCEVTLEANPDHVTAAQLVCYQQLGINRLSLGVQSLDKRHLTTLSRHHSADQAIRSMELVAHYFEHWNVDLIYGIPHQHLDEFMVDLERVTRLGCEQLSLYHLTFEPRTVMGRRFFRQMISPQDLSPMGVFYNSARQFLREQGFYHEEVSHFVKSSPLMAEDCCGVRSYPRGSRHNWNYWQLGSYFGVGAGAHGFIRDHSPAGGIRYSFTHNDRHFKAVSLWDELSSGVDILREYLGLAAVIVDQRNAHSLVLEIVMSTLRTCQGVPLGWLKQLGRGFEPNSELMLQLERGLIGYHQDYLVFDPSLWLYEQSYIQAVLDSIV